MVSKSPQGAAAADTTQQDLSTDPKREREPMKLWRVFALGFIASAVVICGLIWLYAAYETANWVPWVNQERLTQDKIFEIVRNAVTTAAALGVGITLFFSYRRQQTAEQTQRIGAEAQLTASKAQEVAAQALKLSNKQHELDQSRRADAVISELRSRYAKTAEQLGSEQPPVKLAGIYSLAALADDWSEQGNPDERQVCIDLLSSYFKLQMPTTPGASECKAAVMDVVTTRLMWATEKRKYWGSCKITLRNFGQLSALEDLVIRDGGLLRLSGVTLGTRSVLEKVQLLGGAINFPALKPNRGLLTFREASVYGGDLTVSTSVRVDEQNAFGTVEFDQLRLMGGVVRVRIPTGNVVFTDCVFKRGSLKLSAATGGSVSFVNCRFEGDVFATGRKLNIGGSPIHTTKLTIDERCTFAEGVPVLEPFDRS